MSETKKNNLIHISGILQDASKWDVRQCLRDSLDTMDDTESRKAAGKVLIIFLNTTDEGYDTSYSQAGMRVSEMLSLCRVLAHHFERVLLGLVE